ncbi:MAG: hypothetical protein N2042_01950 [Thermodesulfovibrio sp.]|nr:hypothetical protein [Thermodesulfovibrio sp.]
MREKTIEIQTVLGKYNLYGWDDEKIYFWDGEREICVSDDKELYNQLIEICIKYIKGKINQK